MFKKRGFGRVFYARQLRADVCGLGVQCVSLVDLLQ